VTQEKVVRVVGYYRDPGFLERVVASFRKLWVNIYWMYARRINEEGLYEAYLGVEENKNTKIAILNLSKTVDVEKVEVLEASVIETYIISPKLGEIRKGNEREAREYDIVIYVPVFSKVNGYSWGEKYSKDLY